MTRRKDDFYRTPAWCVHALLQHVHLPGGLWLEPSAGDLAIIRAVNHVRSDVEWYAVEPEETRVPPIGPYKVRAIEYVRLHDARVSLLRGCALALGNPPYKEAFEHVVHLVERVRLRVVFLLRLDFLASQKRGAWLSRNAPDVYVLSERPSFDGGNGQYDYGWFDWPYAGRREGIVRVLDVRSNGSQSDFSDEITVKMGIPKR